MQIPKPGQKTIPLKDWRRFLRVADWFERTVEQGNGTRPPSYGQSLIVKTPEDGIDARDGTTISSATCIKCVAAETSTPGERTIHETDEELVVYNPENHDVPGEIYVKTTLSPNGTRYVDMQTEGLTISLKGDDNQDVTFPQYGVGTARGSLGLGPGFVDSRTTYSESHFGSLDDHFVVNLGDEIVIPKSTPTTRSSTPGTMATARPEKCLASNAGILSDLTGYSFGLKPKPVEPAITNALYLPDDFTLYPFLPGFVAMSSVLEIDDVYTIMAMQDLRGPWWAKATEDFDHSAYAPDSSSYVSIACNPCSRPVTLSDAIDGGNVRVYDGIDLTPEITFEVRCEHRPGRAPNILTDNVFPYSIPNVQINQLWPTLDGLAQYDDPIGTVKMWNLSSASIPQGWQQVSGSSGRFLKAANTWSVSGTFGMAGAVNSSMDVILIERFE